MGGRQDAQFLEDHIGPELDGLWRVVVIDAVIDAVFVHALLQQVADDEIDGWRIGVVGEGPRVRHHAAVDTLRHLQRHLVVGAQLPQQAEDEFRRARHRGMGDGERRLDGRAHMVVDEQSGRLRLGNDVRHVPPCARGRCSRDSRRGRPCRRPPSRGRDACRSGAASAILGATSESRERHRGSRR